MFDRQDGTAGGQITLTALLPDHAADAARLHILGQPGTFLTSLGPEVLTVLYQTLPASQHAFGFAAIDPQRPASLIGFVSATTSTGALFAELGTRRLRAFLPPLARRFARQPALIARAAQTALYPFLHAAPRAAGPPPAELLSIMVEPAARSHGIGALLVAALKDECRRRGIARLEVTVDAANDGAQRFYTQHGFGYADAFTLYGRSMRLFRVELPIC